MKYHIEETDRHCDGQFAVVDDDGDVMSCFPTREEAEIEMEKLVAFELVYDEAEERIDSFIEALIVLFMEKHPNMSKEMVRRAVEEARKYT